jgi:ADP-ribosylglycohydrolase
MTDTESMSHSEPMIDRARGALLGLAAGDAAGSAAMYHRTIRLGDRRGQLWRIGCETDEHQIARVAQPFSHGRRDPMLWSGTDDAEWAALTALLLVEAGPGLEAAALWSGWQRHVVAHGDEIWSGAAERASIVNATRGLVPPATGTDNPQAYSDGSVARAVAVGVRCTGDAITAARVAGDLASITHAEDGIWCAQAMAAAISSTVAGASISEAVTIASAHLPADSWTGRVLQRALRIGREAESAFAAVPVWHDDIVNWSYSYGDAAPETFPLALAIVLTTGADLTAALGCAAMLPKQGDTMPAMVGALIGSVSGADAFPASWRSRLDTMPGVCVPGVRGQSLSALADRLLAQRQ